MKIYRPSIQFAFILMKKRIHGFMRHLSQFRNALTISFWLRKGKMLSMLISPDYRFKIAISCSPDFTFRLIWIVSMSFSTENDIGNISLIYVAKILRSRQIQKSSLCWRLYIHTILLKVTLFHLTIHDGNGLSGFKTSTGTYFII